MLQMLWPTYGDLRCFMTSHLSSVLTKIDNLDLHAGWSNADALETDTHDASHEDRNNSQHNRIEMFGSSTRHPMANFLWLPGSSGPVL